MEEPYDLLALAIIIAAEAHDGQVDKGGAPYILHPSAVAAGVKSCKEKIVAYLHDVCEDTDVTIEDLKEMGFPDQILNAINILTKPKDMPYDEYICSVKQNDIARKVKISDLKHNMDISRIPNPTEKDYKRIEKYEKALILLENAD